jgi:hypothetical protein
MALELDVPDAAIVLRLVLRLADLGVPSQVLTPVLRWTAEQLEDPGRAEPDAPLPQLVWHCANCDLGMADEGKCPSCTRELSYVGSTPGPVPGGEPGFSGGAEPSSDAGGSPPVAGSGAAPQIKRFCENCGWVPAMPGSTGLLEACPSCKAPWLGEQTTRPA